jgi:hypothetical protein
MPSIIGRSRSTVMRAISCFDVGSAEIFRGETVA